MTTRCYRSKIGRLPFAIRNELNERIRDGSPGPAILDWLNGLKETRRILKEFKTDFEAKIDDPSRPQDRPNCAISPQNLTDWRSSGYADWLKDQERADRVRRLAEMSSTIATSAGGNAAGVGCNIATAKIMDILEETDPEKVADLAKALVQLRASENAAQKVALAKQKNDIAEEQLSLSRAKFERDTARLFVKWAQNKDAVALATDRRLGGDEKTERLGRLMFGDLWEGADGGR